LINKLLIHKPQEAASC